MGSAEDGDLELAPDDAGLDEHLVVLGEGRGEGGVELPDVDTLLTPTLDPARAGLTKTGQAESRDRRAHAGRSREPIRRP